MIKLKDLLYEMNLLIPRKVEGRIQKYIQLKIQQYKENNNVGNFDISELGLTEFPASLKHLEIGGDFICSENLLTSLTNAPTSVKSFYCRDNNITSLAGAPTSVTGIFYCDRNLLDTLAGAPTSVGGNFSCYGNILTSLVGAPTRVVGNFDCSYNQLESLDGLIRDDDVRLSVGLDFYCSNNKVKFTEEQVRAVCDVTGKIRV